MKWRWTVHHWPQRQSVRVTRSIIAIELSISATIKNQEVKNNVKLWIIQGMVTEEQRFLKMWTSHPHASFSQRQNKWRGEKKTMQWLLLETEKEKCSEATCPLPMSHAALSPLVGEPWGREPSPGQSVMSTGPECKFLQVSSACGRDWTGLQRGRGHHGGPTRGPHLKQHERRQTGFSCRGGGVLEV